MDREKIRNLETRVQDLENHIKQYNIPACPPSVQVHIESIPLDSIPLQYYPFVVAPLLLLVFLFPVYLIVLALW